MLIRRNYETIYIIDSKAADEVIEKVISKVSAIITEHDSVINQNDRWGMRKLAYDVRGRSKGYYVFCHYTAGPDVPKAIEAYFNIDEQVMKYMTVKEKKKPVVRKRVRTNCGAEPVAAEA